MREGEMIYTLLGPEMTKNLHKALDSLNEQHLSPDIIRIKDELSECMNRAPWLLRYLLPRPMLLVQLTTKVNYGTIFLRIRLPTEIRRRSTKTHRKYRLTGCRKLWSEQWLFSRAC